MYYEYLEMKKLYLRDRYGGASSSQERRPSRSLRPSLSSSLSPRPDPSSSKSSTSTFPNLSSSSVLEVPLPRPSNLPPPSRLNSSSLNSSTFPGLVLPGTTPVFTHPASSSLQERPKRSSRLEPMTQSIDEYFEKLISRLEGNDSNITQIICELAMFMEKRQLVSYDRLKIHLTLYRQKINEIIQTIDFEDDDSREPLPKQKYYLFEFHEHNRKLNLENLKELNLLRKKCVYLILSYIYFNCMCLNSDNLCEILNAGSTALDSDLDITVYGNYAYVVTLYNIIFHDIFEKPSDLLFDNNLYGSDYLIYVDNFTYPADIYTLKTANEIQKYLKFQQFFAIHRFMIAFKELEINQKFREAGLLDLSGLLRTETDRYLPFTDIYLTSHLNCLRHLKHLLKGDGFETDNPTAVINPEILVKEECNHKVPNLGETTMRRKKFTNFLTSIVVEPNDSVLGVMAGGSLKNVVQRGKYLNITGQANHSIFHKVYKYCLLLYIVQIEMKRQIPKGELDIKILSIIKNTFANESYWCEGTTKHILGLMKSNKTATYFLSDQDIEIEEILGLSSEELSMSDTELFVSICENLAYLAEKLSHSLSEPNSEKVFLTQGIKYIHRICDAYERLRKEFGKYSTLPHYNMVLLECLVKEIKSHRNDPTKLDNKYSDALYELIFGFNTGDRTDRIIELFKKLLLDLIGTGFFNFEEMDKYTQFVHRNINNFIEASVNKIEASMDL